MDSENRRRASLSDICLSELIQEPSDTNEDADYVTLKTESSAQQIMEASERPVILTQVTLSLNSSHEEISPSNILDALQKSEQDAHYDFEDATPNLLSPTFQQGHSADSDEEFGFDLPEYKTENTTTIGILSDTAGQGSRDWNEIELKASQHGRTKPGITMQQDFETKTEGSWLPRKEDNAKVFSSPEATQQTSCLRTDSERENHALRDQIITSSAADWDNIETVEAGFSDMQSGKGEPVIHTAALLPFSEAWTHFCSADNSGTRNRIRVTAERHGISAIIHSIFGPPRLQRKLQPERELVFCAAASALPEEAVTRIGCIISKGAPLDNQSPLHVQCLQTTYCILTGSCFGCQRFGSHWEQIGFQGQDPATDLRGTGMLGLLQLLFLLQDTATAQLARDLYKLSQHPTQNFPFCVMCINISRICLQALREEILNRECNKQQAVMTVVNQLYAGALLYLHRLWKKGKTIRDSGFVIKEIETRTRKNAKAMLQDLHTYAASSKPPADDMEEGNFFNVVKLNT